MVRDYTFQNASDTTLDFSIDQQSSKNTSFRISVGDKVTFLDNIDVEIEKTESIECNKCMFSDDDLNRNTLKISQFKSNDLVHNQNYYEI